MSSIAVILLILSAILHASWNLLGKKSHPSTAYFLTANTIGCVSMMPVLFLHWSVLSFIPIIVWILLFVTGFFQAIYMWGLASAYRHGSISIAYPLLRTAPILFVALFTTLFNQGELLTPPGVFGIAIVTVGCILVPIRNLRSMQASTFFNLSCLFALFGALGTAGYTLVDDRALSILRSSQQLQHLSTTEISLLYLFLECLSCTLWLSAVVVSRRSNRLDLQYTINKHLGKAALTGITMTLTYFLVLISMAYVENVSYVVAFRQLSVPVAVFLGVYLLKEDKSLFKLVGALATFFGIVLVSLG